jgi:hypothetical protein
MLEEADMKMLTGSTSTEEQNAAYRRMEEGTRNGGKEIRVSGNKRDLKLY